ncbi:conjugal transfer protein [Enterococcus wangshanyuanii]|uniref:Conjugal transfer protein n=1 Tax=Enterococcus wangshanyuanii TaxID=2005703 RepID=A0ABQ1PCX4_9ENTE|nr:conjugal transfer protein [Enterococcus wangshanyuanii]GGC94749.1 conjugal transfer protein [Enterococcus wangshanyuanii]
MKYYDYSRGLKAPYQLQVIRSPKGKLVWAFSQPVSLSYFVVFILFFILFLSVGQVFTFPIFFQINVNLIILFFVPHKIARWYVETEIDGKKGIVYLKDAFSYVREFVIDKRSIYRFERVNEIEEFQFKR